MIELNLLIVEDDESMIETYKSNIKNYNEEHPDTKFNPDFKRNLEDGLEVLRSDSYDAAIIDIKLSSDDEEGKGNKILRIIKENLRFPVCVISGYPQDIEDDLREENIFWKIYKRDEAEIEEVLSEFIKIAQSGILNILGNKGKIEEYLKKIFWNHIAKHFEEIIKYSPSNNIEQVLIRYISTYLMEYMDINSAISSDERYTPPEFYIKPPVRNEYFTGDLIKIKEELFVILTPPCDMIKRRNGMRNAEKFLCARIQKWSDIESGFKEITKKTGKNNDKRKNLVNYMKNKKERYHFIPPYKDIPAGFIDFQTIASFTEDEITQDCDRIATISSFFMRDIIARFSRYYARQGQPDLDIEKILEEILPDDNSE